MRKLLTIIVLLLVAKAIYAQNWYQAGIRVSTQFPLVRAYSDVDYLSTLKTPHIGGYFRAGKYVYGEVGLGYQYFKSRFDVSLSDPEPVSDMVETRYLVIPVKAVGNVQITKKIAFQPYVGILYQPLLKVTDNILGYSKQNIENHWTLLTTGFDFRFGFLTLGVDYRYSFQYYFRDKTGRKPQFISISAGVIF